MTRKSKTVIDRKILNLAATKYAIKNGWKAQMLAASVGGALAGVAVSGLLLNSQQIQIDGVFPIVAGVTLLSVVLEAGRTEYKKYKIDEETKLLETESEMIR